MTKKTEKTPEKAPEKAPEPVQPVEQGPASVQEAHDRAREESARKVEAGKLRAGTEGGVPDPSIQPGTGTVTDPIPGQAPPKG